MAGEQCIQQGSGAKPVGSLGVRIRNFAYSNLSHPCLLAGPEEARPG
jgi:hypothetical protein